MTPGQVAFAAFWATDLPDLRGVDWAALPPSTQARWEAAAQAVLAMEPLQEPRIPTCRWCGQPVAAHPHGDLQWRCQLNDGPLLPTEGTP